MTRSVFYRLFPPPEFLQMPIAGIDLSDDAIRFAAFKETRGGLVLDFYGEQALPKGAISQGEIRNAAAVKDTLAAIRKEHKISFARVSVPEEKAYVVRVNLPQMKKSEIRGSIELQFEEQIPIPISEAVFDYDIINETKDNIEVALSALPRDTTMQYLSIFEGTGIKPVAFEIDSEAIARIAAPGKVEETCMVVDLQKTKTSISITSGNIVRFTSSVHVGGEELVEAVAKNSGESVERAEELLKEKGISVHGDRALFIALIPTLTTIRDEINKHYVYWHSHEDHDGKKHPDITKVILAGEYAIVPGAVDYFSTGLHVPVELASIMDNIRPVSEYIPELAYADSFRYGVALGLGLPRLS
jgi:type IV pilus assembly protein PilM